MKKIFFGVCFFLLISSISLVIFYLLDSNKRLTTLEQSSQIIDTSLGQIEYVIQGEGKPTLFIHGTPGGYDSIFHLRNRKLIKASRPGYLRTPLESGENLEQQAQLFSELLNNLNLPSVDVIAVSGGGPTALMLAKNFPTQVRSLTLLAAVSQNSPQKRAQALPLFETDFSSWLFIYAMHLIEQERVLKPVIPEQTNRDLILQQPAKMDLMYEALWLFWPLSRRQVGQDNDWKQFEVLNADYSAISIPILIIHGSKDINVSVKQSIQLAQQLPDAQLQIIEGADHFMSISHSEHIQAMIELFLSEQNNN